MRNVLAAGVCVLSLSPALAGPPDPGEDCAQAIPAALPSVHVGNTSLFSAEPDDPPCGPGWMSPSVWFAVTGTGSPVRAVACDGTGFDAILVVFAGSDCANLACVRAVDDECGLFPWLEWPTEAGERYLVVIRGVGFSGGPFTLRFESAGGEDCDNDGAPDAAEIAADPTLDCFGPGPPGQTNGPDGRLDACQCSADWDRSAAVNSTDISAFLTSWLGSIQSGSLGADLDCSGSTNSTDIAVFLTRWLGAITNASPTDGCP